MKPIYIEARDIPDAWFQCVSEIQNSGFKYIIEHGSYIGQTRLEFDWITIKINHPYAEPYDLMLPDIPIHIGIPNPVAPGYIEQYIPYLMTSKKEEKEDYTYGNRISGFLFLITNLPLEVYSKIENSIKEKIQPSTNFFVLNQIEHFINLLKKTPNTNQAILQIAQPQDCLLSDPPCLRHIDLRIKDNKLIFYPYFRSWSLWGGFPANLAVLAVLQAFMSNEIGVDPGEIIASSKGLHLYGFEEDLARLRCMR